MEKKYNIGIIAYWDTPKVNYIVLLHRFEHNN